MSLWSQRRLRPSGERRNAVVLAIIVAMIAAVLPPAANGTHVVPILAAGPGDGTVEVPDHPEGRAFNPNQLKDIKAA
ncbi:MAG TPA: hypothetical protein VHH53_14755, partial [Pseudonocardiaceae bacterium]|nr:hypothetical protein [Pseudonocardiaceae bacterium]